MVAPILAPSGMWSAFRYAHFFTAAKPDDANPGGKLAKLWPKQVGFLPANDPMYIAITPAGVHIVSNDSDSKPRRVFMSIPWADITSMGSKGGSGNSGGLLTMDIYWEPDEDAPAMQGQALEILEPQFKFALKTPDISPKAIMALWRDYAEFIAEQPAMGGAPPPPPK